MSTKYSDEFGMAVRERLTRLFPARGKAEAWEKTGVHRSTLTTMAQGHVPSEDTLRQWARGIGEDEAYWVAFARSFPDGKEEMREWIRAARPTLSADAVEQILAIMYSTD